MAYRLEKEKTGSTPYILIDEEKSYMRFAGESFHENVVEFYGEIEQWLRDFLQSDFSEFTFDCELKYFNSSTAKMLLNMPILLDEHAVGRRKMTVNWITQQENDIIIKCGEDFLEEMQNLTFKLLVR